MKLGMEVRRTVFPRSLNIVAEGTWAEGAVCALSLPFSSQGPLACCFLFLFSVC